MESIWGVFIYQKKRSKSTTHQMDGLHAWHESHFIIHVHYWIIGNAISICNLAPA
jgi:predicted homoserine dehydrogenase-like protein